MTSRKYEYAVFPVLVKMGTPVTAGGWPVMDHQVALLEEMNRLGQMGWEVFSRTQPRDVAAVMGPEVLFPYNLWARREL